MPEKQTAYAHYELSKGYTLDEGRLRKIDEILKTRSKHIEGQSRQTFKVYRSDALVYTTTDLHILLAERNDKSQHIERVTIGLASDDTFELSLDFDQTGVYLDVEGNDRDFVYVIFSDIRNFIEHNASTLNNRDLPFKVTNALVFAFIAVSITPLINITYKMTSFRPPIRYEDALNSSDVLIKLNYLISRTPPIALGKNLLFSMSLLLAASAVMIFRRPIYLLIRYLFPLNIFLIGEEIGHTARRANIRNSIFWVVIVGSTISTITGFFVWFLTTS